MTSLEDVFWRAHADLPREAPGSRATTELLLRVVGDLPAAPQVLDVGCGTGPASVLLAELLPGSRVTAVDLHQPFLDELDRRAAAAGVSERVHTLCADMADLPVPPGTVDLVWAEGSAYVAGVDTALAAWRSLLAPGGAVVLTEAEWLTPEPSAGARSFWDTGYPAMRTTAGNVEAFQRAGWRVEAAYVLPEGDWDEYYRPLAERLALLRAEGVAEDLLAQVGEEIEVRSEHAADYGYTGYVLRPRT